MKYQLEYDPTLFLSIHEKKEAFDRMARYGTWTKDKNGWWWIPDKSQHEQAEKRIKREGYLITSIA